MKCTKHDWLQTPESHDYEAAASYLSLLFDEATTWCYVNQLRDMPIVWFHAKDILRASRLPLLDETNRHVQKDLQKMDGGEKLSPILLVRDSLNAVLLIADGYHRMVACYICDEDALIPCQIVGGCEC